MRKSKNRVLAADVTADEVVQSPVTEPTEPKAKKPRKPKFTGERKTKKATPSKSAKPAPKAKAKAPAKSANGKAKGKTERKGKAAPSGMVVEILKLSSRKDGVTPAELNALTEWKGAPWRWLFQNPKKTGYCDRWGYKFDVVKDDKGTHYKTVKLA